MPIEPTPEEMGLSAEEMKTPEQREKFERFRLLVEPMVDSYWKDGETPFGIKKSDLVDRIAERRFEVVEAENLEPDYEFWQEASEVMAQIEEGTGQHNPLGEYPLMVLQYHLSKARGVEVNESVKDYFIAKEMEKGYKKATGRSLSNWAAEYVGSHPEEADFESVKKTIGLFERDYNSFELSTGNLAKVLLEYARENGIEDLDPNTALKILSEKGFTVPEHWQDSFAELPEGRELLGAIENTQRKFHTEEIVTTLEGIYGDFSQEELKENPITVRDILGVASVTMEISKAWDECDDETKQTVTNIMKQLAGNLGGKLSKSKGEPVIKF
jgi:hypothetical protein